MQLGVPRRPGEGPVGRRPRALRGVRRRHYCRGGRSDRGRVRAPAARHTPVAWRSAVKPRAEFSADAGTGINFSDSRATAGSHADAATSSCYRDSGGVDDRSDTVSDAGVPAGHTYSRDASACRNPAAVSASRRTGAICADSVRPALAAGRFRGPRTGDSAGIIGAASGSTAVRGTHGCSAPASGATTVRVDARASSGGAGWRAATRGETRAEHAGATRDTDCSGPTGSALGARSQRGGWWVGVYADARADQSVSRQRPEREGSAPGAGARVRSRDVLPAAARRRPSRRNAARAFSRRDQEVTGRVRRASRPRFRGIDDPFPRRAERYSRRRTAHLLTHRTCADWEVALG